MWLDYARVIVSALWKRLDQESIVKNKNKVYFFNNAQHFSFFSNKMISGWTLNDQPKLGSRGFHNRASLSFASLTTKELPR